MKKTTMLRKLLKEPGLLIVPAAYDCLSARCVETVGFKAVFMSGAAFRDAVLGVPDIGLATATEVVNCAKYIANSVNIPLVVDADDAFGAMLVAYRTTQELIRAGAAGMFISDRAPFVLAAAPHSLVEVLPRNEYLGKMRATLEARDKEDKDFLIAARIDAGATLGDEEVLSRAKACLELGVDVILPHFRPPKLKFGLRDKNILPELSKTIKVPEVMIWRQRDKKALKQLYKKIGAPKVLIWGLGPHTFTAKDYEDIGAKLWVTGYVTFVTAKALLDFYQKFHDTGVFPQENFSPVPEGPSGDRLRQLRGLDF